MVGVAGLDRDEDHRAQPARALADVRDLGHHADSVAGADRLEVLPLRAAVEAAKLAHADFDFRNRGAERAAEGRRRNHPAKAGFARGGLVVEERVGIPDRLGEAADRAALHLDHAPLPLHPDLLAHPIRYVLVRHRSSPLLWLRWSGFPWCRCLAPRTHPY